MRKTHAPEECVFNGQPISPGIAIGKALVFDEDFVEVQRVQIPEEKVDAEIEKFKTAILNTLLDLQQIIDQVGTRVSGHKRDIFDAHRMILEDTNIINTTIEEIKQKRCSADYAYFFIMRNYQLALSSSDDTYLRERELDIRDIKRRVIRKIQGTQEYAIEAHKDSIAISREINLFDIFSLMHDKLAGIVLEGGGRTTHTAIMIRAFELPAVFGVRNLMHVVKVDDILVVNGMTGKVIVNPKKSTLQRCRTKRNNFLRFEKRYLKVGDLPSVSADGVPFEVNANIELGKEVTAITSHGNFGIGLFRTEYIFMTEDKLPTEEEQYDIYSEVVKTIQPKPVTIRTIDLGGDKVAPFLDIETEPNPFLGWRAIRISLDMPDILRKQLRAIYRASTWGNVKLLLPLISSIEEVHQVKRRIEETKTELFRQNIDFDPHVPLGVMIEVPSAAVLADHLAKEVDFFSIGTNDLVQYTLAVDRGNAKVAHLYNFFHPSVLQMIKMAVTAGKRHDIPVGMCGEMAGDPFATLLLFGMGITEFSVSPIMLLKIKQILRSVTLSEAEYIQRKCMKLRTVSEVEAYLRNTMLEIFPGMDEDDFFRRSSERNTVLKHKF